MRVNYHKKQRIGIRSRIFILIGYLIFILVMEFTLMRTFLRKWSVELSELMKDSIRFASLNESFVLTIYILNSKWIFVFICGIILNFSTVYKLFVFVINIFIGCFTIAIFQIFTRDELVYYNINFKIYKCVCFYGSPSIITTLTTIGALTIRHIGVIQGKSKIDEKIKLFSNIGVWMYISLISIINFFSFINSLDQIIFGILLGLGIYYFVFYLLEINTEKGKFFLNFLKKNIVFHLLYIIIPSVSFIISYFSVKPNEDEINELDKKLSTVNCPTLENLDMFYQQNYFSIALASIILFYPIIILLLKLDHFYNFKEKENNWINYNFNNEPRYSHHNDDDSLISDISVGDKDTRWNKTDLFKSLIRLIITYIILYVILIIFHLVEIKTENIFLFILGNVYLPYGLIFSLLFYLFKILFERLFLSNEYVIILSG